MFSSWVRKCVLAAALAVMPLHGVAATLTVLLCHGDAQAHATHASSEISHDHASHTHDATPPQDEHGATQGDAGGTGSSPFHLCCNLTASAPPALMETPAQVEFLAQAFTTDSLHDLFVPELPQRPPLA
jgi:hypothetical protein